MEGDARKAAPLARGLLDYFPDACKAVAALSLAATKQHHPNKEMHWDRSKSMDHADCVARHLIDRGAFDTDGQRHSAKVAWRALAMLQIELEEAARQKARTSAEIIEARQTSQERFAGRVDAGWTVWNTPPTDYQGDI